MADKRLISLDEALGATHKEVFWTESEAAAVRSFLVKQPKVDAIPVADIEAWLYQIAMNNVGGPSLLSASCVEIISRLDGLRKFSRERDV